MSSQLGVSAGVGVAGNGFMAAILRHRGTGPHVCVIYNEGPGDVRLQFEQRRESSTRLVAADEEIEVVGRDTGYDGDGSKTDFTGKSIVTPGKALVPGTVRVQATTDSPALLDEDEDGVLWQQEGARLLGAEGEFATLAEESFVVVIDGGEEQTITVGTEATIGAAVTAINGQLEGAVAAAQDSDNVMITSSSKGKGSSVKIVSVDAGLVTKLGLQVGEATNEGGFVDYDTGALDLNYVGYAPTSAEAILVDLHETTRIAAKSSRILRIPNMQEDDELVVSALGYGAPATVRAKLTQI